MQLVRDAGDNYPIDIIIKVNGIPIDISGSTVTLTYIKDVTTKTITGSITDALTGKVRFSPGMDDFTTVGTYAYKIKRVAGGITTTHLKGQLAIV